MPGPGELTVYQVRMTPSNQTVNYVISVVQGKKSTGCCVSRWLGEPTQTAGSRKANYGHLPHPSHFWNRHSTSERFSHLVLTTEPIVVAITANHRQLYNITQQLHICQSQQGNSHSESWSMSRCQQGKSLSHRGVQTKAPRPHAARDGYQCSPTQNHKCI